jgi:[protein-PII] uridylyltransferase
LDGLKDWTGAAALAKAGLSATVEALRARHLERGTGSEVCRSYAAHVDGLVSALFSYKARELGCAGRVALAAVGGYGRGELNIRSDIDLLLVHKGRSSSAIEELTQQVLYVLWDTGLDLGFSLRSVDECIALARGDLKTMTALLDLRFLFGEREVYAALESRVSGELFRKRPAERFIEEKLEENRQRHGKYGGSVYLLEPNVKEGEGGLRDLHTARWIIKARDGARVEPIPIGPGGLGLITGRDEASLDKALDFLLWVRNDLHFAAGRKTDQLTFDHQERIAETLGFSATEHALAVENFMQQYYRRASDINRLSNLMLSRTLNSGGRRGLWRARRKLDANYAIEGGVLTAVDADAVANDPAAAMAAFEHSQANGVEMDQTTKDLVISCVERAGETLLSSAQAAESFKRILKGPDVFKTLVEMQKTGFLERFIPEFGEISCKVQHDLYHVYTVDAHTLMAVREIERLKGVYRAEFPLLSMIFDEVPNPEVLYLGVLLHDIGKAHGKGHAEKGALLAPAVCRRLHFSDDDAETVRFLVKRHLVLADTAQYRDLHDEKLVIEFAKAVGDVERLNLLYLLTFADVRAVGPDVWNHWKGSLFQELYFKAVTVLERGTFEVEDTAEKILRIEEKVASALSEDGVARATVRYYFELLPRRYVLSTSPEFISGHIRVLEEMGGGRPFSLTVRQDTLRHYTEFVVCTHDMHGLFSMIAGVMAANAVNILGAQINTLKNGVVLDVLQVNSRLGELITDEARLRKIEADLGDVITGRVSVAALVGRRRPSILDAKARPRVRSNVQIDNEVSDSYTVVDVHAQNRIGLLYDITSALSGLGLYIHVSKISTKGDEAADIFYVKDIFGQKIYYGERLKEIKETLLKSLEGAAGGKGPEDRASTGA